VIAIIFDLATSEKWQKAKQQRQYEADSLQSEGFIHCSSRDQLIPMANHFLRDWISLVAY